MTKRQQWIVWVIWTAIFPTTLIFFVIRGLPILRDEWFGIIAFLCLLLIASLFPIRFRHTNIVPIHGIALAVFLQYGLFIEMIVMQLAVLTSLLSLKLPKRDLYRFPLNSLVFFVVSVVSASLYYIIGGTTGIITEGEFTSMILPIALYAFVYFFFNNWLIFFIRKYIIKIKNTKFFDEALKWEAITSILIIPIGISLMLLFQEVGIYAIFLVGIPLICLSLILKLYNESQTTGRLLRKISSFGYQINENLPVQKITDLFMKTVADLFPVDHAYVYEKKNGKLVAIQEVHSKQGEGESLDNKVALISQSVFSNRKSHIYTKSKQWENVFESYLPGMESIMVVPSIRENEVVAVITVTSKQKRAFEKSHLMLLEIMANYLVVAVQNARMYEQKKNESERCALTNLYNYRYFENALLQKYDTPSETDNFGIILLDLDHFKRINDSFGHHSGNEVLCQVAKVLQNTLDGSGTLARYGGEEFVILLEGDNVHFAKQMAELLRKELESNLFIVSNDLGSKERKSVRITASIGVAVKSEADESAMSVLRNADRAMYTGAKQQGRNKVAYY
ncbi:sensor domain-containing diguanylate cyclase [Evansella sp. AB-rgal1]|uniref:sensor domain-containing diguanylate cyclase n=1 Tax=Evansella sp. AB-rgal1 TaxID=3242696 RepID=UPI00359EA5F8